MANANWIANAQARPDVWWATPASVTETTWFALEINNKTIKVYAGDKDSSGTATAITAAGIVQLLKDAIDAADIPEWKELEVTMGILYPSGTDIEVVDSGGTTLILTGPDDGKPVTISCSSGTTVTPTVNITETTQGIVGQNEKQTVTIPSSISGGTFTLTFSGQTTAAIAYNATAYAVRDALCALSNIAGTDEVQEVAITGTPDGGTFTLTYAGQTTGNIAFNASAATVQAALEALSNIAVGDVTCAGGALPGTAVTVTFHATLGASDVAEMTASGAGLTGGTAPAVAVSTTTPGVASDVTVTGTAPTWIVEFGGAYAQTDVPLMTGSGASLTGGQAITVAEITPGATGGVDEVQTHSDILPGLPGNPRRLKVTVDGVAYYSAAFVHVAAGVAFDASAISAVQAAIDNGVGTSGNLLVIATTSTTEVGVRQYRFQFTGAWGHRDIVSPDGIGLQYNSTTYTGPTWYDMSSYGGGYGVDADATITNGAATGTNEVQHVTVPTSTGGHLHLTFQGEVSAAINYSATPATLAANVQAGLEANTNIGAGNVVAAVYSTNVNEVRVAVTFQGALAAQDVGLMSGDGTSLTGAAVSVSTTTLAVVAVNEVQTITLSDVPTGGTFTLSYGGYTTTALAYNISAADMDTALEVLTSIGAGQVAVTGSAGGPWTVTFGGTLAGTNVALMTGSGYGLTITGTQTIELTRPVVRKYTAGTWVQATRVFTPGTNPTADGVAVGDSACVFADGLVGGTPYMARVSARDTTTITLSADAIEGTPPGNGTTDTTLLIVTAPTGSAYYDNVANWEGDVLPADSDTINAEDGSGAILYNINQSLVTVAAINLKASFSGHTGLGRTDDNDYWQYRTQYLTLGNATDAVPTTIIVGQGDGDGTGHLWLNSGSGQVLVKVHSLAPSADTDLPAFVWKGTHVSNTMEVLKGSVGVALFAGDAAAIATLTIGYVNSQDRDATVTIGAGCTTITTINKYGGTLNLYTGATTLIQDGGETLHVAGAIGTLTLNGGTYIHQNAGNITTLNIYADAVADFSRGDSAVTITNCTIYGKNAPVDPHKRITFTNPPAYKGGGQLSLDWGTTYSIQRS